MIQIKKGAMISYFTVVFSILSGLFFTPYLISKVGKEFYGIYTLVSTFLNYFLIDFGLGNAVAKYLSEFKAKDDYEQVNKFISVIFKLFVILAIVIGIVLFVLSFWLESIFIGLTQKELVILRQMYIISGASSILLFIFIPLDGILTAYELFTELKSIELFRKIFVIFLSVLVLSKNTNIVNIIVVNAVVGFVIVGLKLRIIQRKTFIKIEWYFWDKSVVKTVGGFSFWLTIIMVAQRFIIPITPTILGHFSNSTEISIFSIATTIEGYVYTTASCLNGLFLPKLTQLYYSNDIKEINRLFNRIGRLQTYMIGMLLSSFIVFGQEFIYLWVGEDFLKAYYVALLILPTSIIVYAQEVANSIIMIQDMMKYKAICYCVGAILSTIISCILSEKFGAIGAGIGIAVCLWGSQVVLMNIVYSKITILNIKKFFIDCYSKTIPCLIGIIVFGYLVNKLITTKSIFLLGIKILILCVSLVFIYFFLVFKEEDKQMFKYIKERVKGEL